MKPLTIRCPVTAAVIDTGIGGSYEDLEQNWDKYIIVQCPHCGNAHGFIAREVFAAEAVAGEAAPAASVVPGK